MPDKPAWQQVIKDVRAELDKLDDDLANPKIIGLEDSTFDIDHEFLTLVQARAAELHDNVFRGKQRLMVADTGACSIGLLELTSKDFRRCKTGEANVVHGKIESLAKAIDTQALEAKVLRSKLSGN